MMIVVAFTYQYTSSSFSTTVSTSAPVSSSILHIEHPNTTSYNNNQLLRKWPLFLSNYGSCATSTPQSASRNLSFFYRNATLCPARADHLSERAIAHSCFSEIHPSGERTLSNQVLRADGERHTSNPFGGWSMPRGHSAFPLHCGGTPINKLFPLQYLHKS